MSRAWLQAPPGPAVLPPPPPKLLYVPADRTPPEQIAESWHRFPQERVLSKSLDTSQAGINARTEGMEVTESPSLEEGKLTQSEGSVQEPKLDLLCSPLLVIQDNFATPDLPLLTCLTQDQEFEPDSSFQQSELEFAPLRGIPDKSEDIEWLSRPSDVSEALFQATAEAASDLVNSCLSISQHPLTGSTAVGSQRSLFPPEQRNNGENGPSNADEPKTPNDSDHYDALYSYMSWHTRKDSRQPEGNVATSTFSDVSDGSITTKRDDSFDASCSQMQYWKQGASQQAETCLANKDHSSFPCEIAPPCPNKTSYSFLRCMLERGKGAPLTSGSHPENVCLRAPSEGEMSEKMGSLEGCERHEDLQKELSQYCKQKETRNNLSSELHPTSPEIKYMGTIVVPGNHEQVSEAHILSRGLNISKVEASGGLPQTVKSNLDETSGQLFFQEERNQKAVSLFGEKNVDATENVAFEAVIAAIEPSKQESPVSEVQTDISKSLADDSQERKSPNLHLSPLNYNSEKSFIDKFKHLKYQSTPGVFEPAASKPMLHKEDDDASSLYWYTNLKSPPNASQNMLSQPFSVIPELKSSPLSEKAYSQAIGLGKTQSSLFPYDIYSLDLTEKVGSSDLIYPIKVSTSDSWVVQDLKQQTFEEVADSSDYYLEGLQGKAESDVITRDGDTEYSSLYENADSERGTELQREGDRSDLGSSQPFPSALPPFVPHEPISEPKYSFNLRMLRVSPDALPTTLRHLTGDTSKGRIAAVIQSKLKPGTTTSLRDPDTGPHSSLLLEDLPRLAVSSFQENVYQQVAPEGHLSEEAPKALAYLGLAEQNTGTSPVIPTSYSQREQSNILYQEGLQDGQALPVLKFPGQADQKSGLAMVSSTASSQGDKPDIFYQQILPDSHIPKEAVKALAALGPTEQKSSLATVLSASYSHRDKPGIFYQQASKAGGHLPEDILKASGARRPTDQKFDVPPVTTTSYSYREKPGIFYQKEFPESHLTENVPKVTDAPGPADQKTGTSKVSSISYSQKERPNNFYGQALPGGLLSEEALQASAAPGTSTISAGLHPLGEESVIFYQPGLPSSFLTAENFTGPAVSGPIEQKTGTPTGPSGSYPVGEKPIIFYQQASPEEALKASAVPRPADQSTAVPAASASSLQRSSVFYQQVLPGSYVSRNSLQASADPGPGDQNPRTSTISAGLHPLGEESVFHQPVLSASPQTAENFTGPAVSGPTEQKTGTPTDPSGSYPVGEKPIIHQQGLPDSHLHKEALNVLTSGPVDPKTGEPTVYSSSYPFGEKPIILYHQSLSDTQLTKEDHRVSVVPGSVDQKTSISLITSFADPNLNSIVSYQQELPQSHLTENTKKVSVVLRPVDQKTGISHITSSLYSNLENSIFSYQEELPDSHLTENTREVSVVPGPPDQKTGIPRVPSTSSSFVERPSVSYQQELQDLNEEALKVLGFAEQKTGIRILSSPYSQKERPSVSYQQELPDLTEKGLQVLGVSEASKQKTEVCIVPSVPYSHEEKPIIQQELPDLNEVALKTGEFPGSTDQKTGIQIVSSGPYLSREKPNGFHQQELPSISKEALGVSVHPGPVVQKVVIPAKQSLSCSSQREVSAFSLQELPASHLTEEALNGPALSELAAQKPGTPSGPSSSYFHREKLSDFYQHALPYHDPAEGSLKASTVPGLSDQNKRPTVSSGSYLFSEKVKISTADLSQDQKTKSPTATYSPYLYREKPVISTVIGPDDQKTPLPTVFHGSDPQRIKPVSLLQKQLPNRDQSEDNLKISTVSEPSDVNTEIPVLLSGSYSHTEKTDTFYPQELPDRHLPEDALRVSSSLGQADQTAWLPTASSGIYSHDEKNQLVSEHVQRLIGNLNSTGSCLSPNNMPLNSQIEDTVIVSKPESSGLGDVSCEEIRDADSGSKILKEIRTLLMEAENIALKRCNFPAPLVPFRDVSDVSFKKVVCFKDPPTTDVCNEREPCIEDCPRIECTQDDIGTQTNLKYQRGIENWEFISSTTIRSPLQEAEDTARMAFDETFRQHKAARSAMRSEPEGCSAAIRNKIIIPMMTIIKSDSSSDVSDGCCSWESNLPESLESVSDVFLNFFPCTSPETSITDSREEEGSSESEGGYGSVDSLAARVKCLLQCESSLNQAKQILRNAEEEFRVRAQAWNLKFNSGHDYGYSILELNEDDRQKVEEIKAELFGHGRGTCVSEGLQSPWGAGCIPEAVCGHIIIESHEKGCFRTLDAEQPQPDGRPCVFRSAESSEVIRGQRSPSSLRPRHINLPKSLDQNNPCFEVGNSLQLQSHPPCQQLKPENFKIRKSIGVSFNGNVDPRPSVEPPCVPPKEMDFPPSQTSPPEPMKQFTTSISFSSHRHSNCISDTSVFKVGVTESSQCTGPSVGVSKFHVPEEQISPRDLRQRTSSLSSLKIHSYSPMTILPEGDKQRQKLPVDFEHSHQKGKLLERSDCKVSHSEPDAKKNYSNFKRVQFSHEDKPSSTLEVKEKNVTLTPDLPSRIFLEQRELFEQSNTPHTGHYVKKYRSPSCPDIAACIFLEQQELFEQSNTPHVDHETKEDHSLSPQCRDYIVSDLPSPIVLEQQQCKSPDIDDHTRTLSQGQGGVIEKIECIPTSHFSNQINVDDTKFSNMISQSASDQRTSASSPSNRKALSCVRITLCPKTTSKLDSGTLDKRFHSLDPACETRINSEFNSDLQTKSSRSLEPTSKLLTYKPIAQDQNLQVAQSPLPASKTITQDLKNIPPQNSRIVTSRQTQVNISDLEEYSKPEGTPVPADGSREQNKTSSGKLSSDAITQITTESPEKITFSSEIFINGDEVLDSTTQKPHKVPVKFASSSVQQVTDSPGKDAQPELLPYKPSGSCKMYYVPQFKPVASFLDSKSDTTIESSHSGSNDAVAPDFPPQVLGTRDDDLSSTVNIKHKEGIYSKRAMTMEKKQLQKDNAESECHSTFENTTHSVFRSAKFYFHHPVHLPHEQDICHESLGRSVFMQHSWKDFFHHHSDIHREHSCLPPPCPPVDKMDYARIKSLSINLNLGDEKMHTTKDHPKNKRQMNDQKKEPKVIPEPTAQCAVSLNELWNKYQERQKQQKPPDICDKKDLSLVERLDRLAKLLQNPITHSLQVSESTQDDSRGVQGIRGRQPQQQKSKLQKQKWYRSLERGHRHTGDLRKSRMMSPQQSRRSNQIKIEQIKLDKYTLRKQPDFNYISNTSSDSRLSEESELLTDSPNILSSTTSPLDSDVLTQTDREVTLHERSSSISTIDTARLIQAFGHERLYLSPRQIKLYSTVTNQQKRYLEKRCKHNKKALNTSHPQMTSELTRRRHIQVADNLASLDSVSSASSLLSLNSTHCNEQNVHMLNKGIQAGGNLEIVTGTKKHTRDVGVTFPTPSSSETRLEDSDMISEQEEKIQQKMFFTRYLGDRKLRKNRPNSCEGVSWFVPVENMKSRSKKENLPKIYGPGITWFEPLLKTRPWREPLREQNCQGQCMDGQGSLGGPGGDGGRVPLRPFVRATLQEALQLHRPDFISRSGERIKRLKLIVQERKLQNLLPREGEVLFSTAHTLPRRVFLAVQKNKPVGKKEMIQRTKRIYEQLPEVKKKREEEKRKSEYKSYRLRAQHYKTKVTNQLLGRKVPWD